MIKTKLYSLYIFFRNYIQEMQAQEVAPKPSYKLPDKVKN